MSVSPTARTLARLRELGWTAEVVERYNSFTKRRTDLAGCIDIVAWRPGMGIMGVQACAAASHATRVAKVKAEPRAALWLASGGLLAVCSWSKRGKAGKCKLWEMRMEEIKPGA